MTSSNGFVFLCLQDLFLDVKIPKFLVLKNPKLGLLHKIMVGSVTVLVVLYLAISQPWLTSHAPFEKTFAMWHENGDGQAIANPNVSHCKNFENYRYDNSETLQFRPNSCRVLIAGDASLRNSHKGIFFPTYVKENYVWQSSGNDCTREAELACRAFRNGGLFSNDTDDTQDVACQCTESDEFFNKNVEQQYFAFIHGFAVYADEEKTSMLSSSSTSPYSEFSDRVSHSTEKIKGTILTVLANPKGDPCIVSGKSTWTQAESKTGIRGTIAEWLECAGYTLDTQVDNLRSGAQIETMAPPLRITGLVLSLTLSYYSKHDEEFKRAMPDEHRDHEGTLCVVTAHADPTWNSRSEMIYTDLPNPFASSEKLSYRHKYTYGVTVEMHADGSFKFFRLTLLISAIVNVIVLFQVPRMIIEVVCTQMLGLTSNIYRSSQNQPLSIRKAFHQICARMMVSSVGFRALTSQLETKGSLKAMPQANLYERVSEIFHEEMNAGILDQFEVERLAGVVLRGLDTRSKGKVTSDQFIHACSSNEIVDLRLMASFFDVDRRSGILERIFDTTKASFLSKTETENRLARTSSSLDQFEAESPKALGQPSKEHEHLEELEPEAVSMVEQRLDEVEKLVQSLDIRLQSGALSFADSDKRTQLLEQRVDILGSKVSSTLDAIDEMRRANADVVFNGELENQTKMDEAKPVMIHTAPWPDSGAGLKESELEASQDLSNIYAELREMDARSRNLSEAWPRDLDEQLKNLQLQITSELTDHVEARVRFFDARIAKLERENWSRIVKREREDVERRQPDLIPFASCTSSDPVEPPMALADKDPEDRAKVQSLIKRLTQERTVIATPEAGQDYNGYTAERSAENSGFESMNFCVSPRKVNATSRQRFCV